uniref:PDZ domain-containing protein n=1 Tax=Scophthalmus maximus TaxID=52904 RepID=A0A8D3A8C7_SCOMX
MSVCLSFSNLPSSLSLHHLPFLSFPPLPLVLSMPSSNQGWPEDFGFQLGGNGPSYILSVEEGSSAHLAGLQAGDQVLEIEGHNVSTLGPQAVMAIAQTQKNIPPSIGVVSRIQQVSQLSNPSQQ